MKKNSFLLILLLVTSCINNKSINSKAEIRYKETKSEFNKILTNHFPDNFSSESRRTSHTVNLDKNNIYIMLCEYDVDIKQIIKIKKNLLKNNFPFYNPNDSCLLIINRFETLRTYETLEIVTEIDTNKLEKECYKTLKPIPNFIGVDKSISKSDLKLNNSYTIFVIESKPGKYFSEYDLKPCPQMPKKWKNGFSKGIAISEKENTVIYWANVW